MFKTVAEAFNHYRNSSLEAIEARANEISTLINTDSAADLEALNIELDGLKQAKENIEERAAKGAGTNLNPITGTNFNNIKVEDADVFATTQYRDAFYKTLLGQKLTHAEAMTYKRAMDMVGAERRLDAFNTITDAAAVIPTLTLNEVISKARTKGGLISVCRSFNIPSNLSVPVATPGAAASWHVEGDAVATEETTTVPVTFTGYELIKILSLSAAAKRMSIAGFEAYIIDELTASVMEAIEDALVNGSGLGQGTGIEDITWVKNTNAIEYAKGKTPEYLDFVKTISLLKRGYAAGSHWAMNNATLYTHVYSVMDTVGRPIFISDPKVENIGRILGVPVVIDDDIASGDIYLGNFNYMGYNMPQAPIIEVSRESSFKSGLIDYRVLAIADCKPLVEEAFVKMYEAAQ